MSYDHKKIERKRQKEWEKQKIYETQDENKNKENFYALVEFPYPSGNLHAGHWYAFSVPDIFARKKRMEGKNVLYPIGFDAFGLPAENAAIKRKINPKKWTYDNIDYMRRQLKSMGASFDWTREAATSDPKYYKWTQWIFLQFFKKGLAYQAETPVNWCPKDKTVLANEQVIGGKCDRCGAEVVQKNMKQWMLRITDYADRLLSGLEKLNWPEEIKEAQRNWIGKSEGAFIKFQITNHKSQITNSKNFVEVFTTRPDTIFGATYMVLAPEHELIQSLKLKIKNWDEVNKYISRARKKTQLQRQKGEKDKTGVELKDVKAINPANNEEIPVWIADYVLMGYGTGAIMAVPAHDQRDFEFAKKYKLPLKHVVVPCVVDHVNPPRLEKPFKIRKNVHALVYDPARKKYLIIRNKKFGWDTVVIGGVEESETPIEAALRELREETGYIDLEFKRILGSPVQATYFAKHKDENRIAIATAIYFELKSDKRVAISEDGDNEGNEILWVSAPDYVPGKMVNSELPYWLERLSSDEDLAYIGSGVLINSGKFDGTDSEKAKWEITNFVGGKKKIQYRLRDWVVSRQRYWGVPIPIVHCNPPAGGCGPQAVPEKDLPVLLPEIKGYLPTGEGKSPLAKAKKWVMVKCPKCGLDAERETDTLDTFVDSSWYFLRYCDPKNENKFASDEKVKNWIPVNLYYGGAEHTTMHLLYSRFWYKAMYDCGLIPKELSDEPYIDRRNHGTILGPDGQKMSKSHGNVVDPDEYVEKFGADTVRMYLAFLGPYNEVGTYPWNPHGILGIKRFLDRVWALSKSFSKFDSYNASLTGDRALIDINHNRALHGTIQKVTEDLDDFKFNTAISTLMIFLAAFTQWPSKESFTIFLKLLAPFAPHLTEEIWRNIGNKESIHLEAWPTPDHRWTIADEFDLVVQINGRVRDKFKAQVNIEKDEAERHALSRPKIRSALEGKAPKKVIFVPKRLINFVI